MNLVRPNGQYCPECLKYQTSIDFPPGWEIMTRAKYVQIFRPNGLITGDIWKVNRSIIKFYRFGM